MKQRNRLNWRALKRRLSAAAKICVFSIAVSAATLVTSGTKSSVSCASAADSISFSVEQADSILDMLSAQQLQILLLRVNLWEARERIRIDSTYADWDRARLEALEKQQDNWFQRVLKNPTVWLIIGSYIGIHAAR